MTSINKFNKWTYKVIYFQFWDTFVFMGFFSTLIMIAEKRFGLSHDAAYQAYGAYLALIYAGTLLGGIIADRFIGVFNSIFLGACLSLTGNLVMLCHGLPLFFAGLALTMTGTALLKSNTSALIGQLHEGCSVKRRKAYVFYYAGMNVGGIVGVLVYGILGAYLSWDAQCLLNSFGILSALIWGASLKSHLVSHHLHRKMRLFEPSEWIGKVSKCMQFLGLIILIWLVAFASLQFHAVSTVGGYLFALAGLGVFIWILKQASVEQKPGIWLIGVFCIVMIAFFTVEFQVGSSILNLLSLSGKHTHSAIHIPYSWVVALISISVVSAPKLLGSLYKKLDGSTIGSQVTSRLFLNLILSVMAYGLLLAVVYQFSTFDFASTALCVAAAVILLGLGEMSMAPLLIECIDTLSPKKTRAQAMSLWCIACSISGFLSSGLARLTLNGSNKISLGALSGYQSVYGFLIIVFIIGIVIVGLGYKFWARRLIGPILERAEKLN